MPTAELWDKYGLPGLVICSLFATLGVLGRLAINVWRRAEERRAEIEEQRTKMFENLISSHKGERTEWRQDMLSAIKNISDQSVAAIRDLTAELTKVGLS